MMLRTATTLIALSMVIALAAPAAADSMSNQKPLCFHGSLGYGKMMEDNAPGGSVGLGLGLLYQKQNSSWGFGLDAGYIMLGTNEESFSGASGDISADIDTNVIPVTGQIYKYFTSGQSNRFYLDGGCGFYNVDTNVDITSGGSQAGSISGSGSDTNFGFNGGLGARFGSPTARTGFGLDMKYHNVMADSQDLGLFTALGRFYFR
jgi:hypothetical protein